MRLRLLSMLIALPLAGAVTTAWPADSVLPTEPKKRLEALQHAGRKALLLAEQAKQDVLGADVVVLEGPRLFLGQYDHLAGALGEAFEHRASILLGPRTGAENGG